MIADTFRLLVSVLLMSLLVVPVAHGVDVTQVSRMQNTGDVAAIPTRSGWMAPSPNRITVLTPEQTVVYTRKVKRNQRLIYSERGEYFGILKYNDHSPTTISLLRLEVFDHSGELIWSVKNPQSTSFVLSDGSPRAAGIVGAEGLAQSDLHLYSGGGEHRRSQVVSHLFGVRFRADGEYLFVNSADSGLAAYDTSGNQIHHFGQANKYCVSEDGRHVALMNSNGISYFKDGVRIKSLAIDFENVNPAVAMRFDPELLFLAVLYKNGLNVHLLPTLEFVWEEKDKSGTRRFTSLDCSSDGLLAVGYDVPSKQDGRKIHTQGGVGLFDQTGNRLWSLELDYSGWTREFPMVCFTRDGKGLQIATADEALLYTISR
jgi:WD40 repeat protein